MPPGTARDRRADRVAHYGIGRNVAAHDPKCLILSDEKNHASVIAGIGASGAEKWIFRHNDFGHLGGLLQETEHR
jgi:7-keto-8-aminopelargonate synthetase-like enzyme